MGRPLGRKEQEGHSVPYGHRLATLASREPLKGQGRDHTGGEDSGFSPCPLPPPERELQGTERRPESQSSNLLQREDFRKSYACSTLYSFHEPLTEPPKSGSLRNKQQRTTLSAGLLQD